MTDNERKIDNEFEVLSPWAEADPVPLRGLSPRLADLTGKKIGLFMNTKRAAPLALKSVEAHLKERYPSLATTWYQNSEVNTPEVKTKNRAKFEEWVKGVDGVVLAVGD